MSEGVDAASTTRCVGGIVHDDTGRLLCVQRAREPAKGQWSLPGGKVHPGESDEAALRRELLEETGLDVSPGQLAGSVVRGPFEIYDYACVVRTGVLRAGDDAANARWLAFADLTDLDRAGCLTAGLIDTLRGWNALPRI